MFKLSIDTSKVAKDKGILYILSICLEDEDIVKVGVTCRNRVEDRIEEILRSIFKVYRYYPYCYPKRFRTVDNVYEKEARLHKQLEDYKYSVNKAINGYTEFFKVDLNVVVKMYEDLLNEDNNK